MNSFPQITPRALHCSINIFELLYIYIIVFLVHRKWRRTDIIPLPWCIYSEIIFWTTYRKRTHLSQSGGAHFHEILFYVIPLILDRSTYCSYTFSMPLFKWADIDRGSINHSWMKPNENAIGDTVRVGDREKGDLWLQRA